MRDSDWTQMGITSSFQDRLDMERRWKWARRQIGIMVWLWFGLMVSIATVGLVGLVCCVVKWTQP
jgi:hypothetical protein